MLSPGHPVRVVLEVLTALLVSGAAVVLALTSSAHPRMAAQVHSPGQSTPANLITLGRYAMRYPVFATIVGQASYSLPAGDGHHSYSWQNTNPLIGAYPGAAGIKTGDTQAAGNCLLFGATRNGLTLIGVTLGTPGDDITATGATAAQVLNWGFSNFQPRLSAGRVSSAAALITA